MSVVGCWLLLLVVGWLLFVGCSLWRVVFFVVGDWLLVVCSLLSCARLLVYLFACVLRVVVCCLLVVGC